MPGNIYILFIPFLAVAVGELDFAVHIEGDNSFKSSVCFLTEYYQAEQKLLTDWRRNIKWSTREKLSPRLDISF